MMKLGEKMKFIQNFAARFDWRLFFILLILATISVVAISSAQTSGQYQTNFAVKQVVWFVAGFIIILMSLILEPDQYKKIAWYLLFAGIISLAMVKFGPFSYSSKGATRWLNLPVIGIIQPSEFVKSFYILALAKVVSKHNENTPFKSIQTDFILLLKMFATLALPLYFILKQDLGTSLVFLSITAGVMIVAGISWKILSPLFLTGGVVAGSVVWMAIFEQDFLRERLGLDEFRMKRIYSWLDPHSYPSEEGYNLIRTLMAIGSGEVSGKGFKNREVYVPENHTDFIFSVLGEEFGFIGSSFVIIMFFVLIYHLTKIALRIKDPFSIYVATGVITMIAFHVIENIGMNIQLLPITGIPLPFISYGGSSIFSMSLAVGLIFSIKFHEQTYMFTDDD